MYSIVPMLYKDLLLDYNKYELFSICNKIEVYGKIFFINTITTGKCCIKSGINKRTLAWVNAPKKLEYSPLQD